MTRLVLAVFSLMTFCYVSAASNAPDDFTTILGGTFDCQTERVTISDGALNKQEFTNLDKAQAALAKSYNKEGVDKLAGLLKNVCLEKKDANFDPAWEFGQAVTAEYRKPGAVAEFNKEGNLVRFKVFEFKDDYGPTKVNAARYYIDKAYSKKKCRPISSVCWRCPDGQITCSIPKVNE